MFVEEEAVLEGAIQQLALHSSLSRFSTLQVT
jgi:hypothetical protein